MSGALAYLPPDRCRAILRGESLPDRCVGTVLFSDISGFTPLTNKLVSLYGPRRGAEEATRRLNTVYEALIEPISQRGGSVIGFSGDGMLTWFDAGTRGAAGAAQDAVACASAMLAAMAPFAAVKLGGRETASLVLKIALASGAARRFVAGAPEVQLIDVLAGTTVDRAGIGEGYARGGEIVADRATVEMVDPAHELVAVWRGEDDPNTIFALLKPQAAAILASNSLSLNRAALPEADPQDERWLRWLLPGTGTRLSVSDERFLAELRPVAALFVRFASFDYETDEDAPIRLNDYVCAVQRQLAEFGGALIQLTTGDKGGYLYATFGAPDGHGDDCARAIAAALSLRELAPNGIETAPQIGVAYGRMRVGAYGSRRRRTYGVQGPPANLAARLMMVAHPGQILVDGDAYSQTAAAFGWERLGKVTVKGRVEPVAIFEPTRYAVNLDAPRGVGSESVLVGRDGELAELTAAADRMKAAGSGGCTLLTGALGSGKSALLRAFVATPAAGSLSVISSVCHSTTGATPYFAARQLARGLLGLDEAQPGGESSAYETVRSKLARWNPDWLWRLPLLSDLLGFDLGENPALAALPPQLRREALIDLFVGIVQKRSLEQPLLLIVDDAHWLDESTLALILAVARAAADMPVLLLAAARPDECPETLLSLTTETNGRTLELDELTEAESGTLVARILGAEVSPLAASVIQSRARGNPLLVEQLVDALVASQSLVQQGGVWSLSPKVMDALHASQNLQPDGNDWQLKPQASLAAVDLGVPNSIQGMFSERLDRLDDDLVMTLKVASAVGRSFSLEVLEHAYPHSVERSLLAEHLAALTDTGLIEVGMSGGEGEYLFRHALFQEVVYQSLLTVQQQELHLAVAKAVQSLHPDAVELLANQYAAADTTLPSVREKALRYLGLSAERNRGLYANETALALFARGLDLDARAEWITARVELLHIVGRREEETAELDRLERFPGTDSVQVALLRSELLEATGAYREAAQHAQYALDEAMRRPSIDDAARATLRLAEVAGREGDYAAEGNYYAQAIALSANEDALRKAQVRGLYGLGIALKQRGDFDEALKILRQAQELARSEQLLFEEARTLNAIGVIQWLTRQFDVAATAIESSLQLRRKIGDRAGIGASLSTLAQIVMHGYGDFGRGLSLLQDALQLQRSIGNRWSEGSVLNELGILYLLCGEYELAEARLRAAMELCEQIGAEAGKAHVGCNLGMTLREMGRLDDAGRMFTQGEAIARELGDRLLMAQYAGERAKFALCKADWDAALASADSARQTLLDLDMEVMTTGELTTIMQARSGRGDTDAAVRAAREAVAILEKCGGVGPDFPQRDYYACAVVFERAGHTLEAEQSLRSAHALLMAKADAISDVMLRESFLHRVAVHAQIVREALARRLA